MTWAQVGEGIDWVRWQSVGLGVTGIALLSVPAIAVYRARSGPAHPPMTVLRWWVILMAAGVVGLATWGGTEWLLSEANQATGADRPKARIDAIRSGLSIGAGTGGALALLLAARRQWHQEKVALSTDHDATERRITELYTKAVEQLGSDKAPVRLGGLHALDRLAQNNVEHRQTIIDVICAYLRMPFTPPTRPKPRLTSAVSSDDAADLGDAEGDQSSRQAAAEEEAEQRRRQEELQVRLTAQDILTRHLIRPADLSADQAAVFTARTGHTFWPGHSLNLTNARLTDFNLKRGHLNDVTFINANFTGAARFADATFTGTAGFDGASFTGTAEFDGATFTRVATFTHAAFARFARFEGVTFTGAIRFGGATFRGSAGFGGAKFAGEAWFGGATFTGVARFQRANFTEAARFSKATFRGSAGFGGAIFTGTTSFGEATFAGAARFDNASFAGAARFEKANFAAAARFDNAVFAGVARFDNASFAGAARFGEAVFAGVARFDNASFAGAARFEKANFTGYALFDEAVFTGPAGFFRASFDSGVGMKGARVLDLSADYIWPAGWIMVRDDEDQSQGTLKRESAPHSAPT